MPGQPLNSAERTRDVRHPADTPAPPTNAGRYQLLDEIGRGGGGVVYRGFDPKIGRPVAVKVLHAQGVKDGSSARRFDAEARLTCLLAHPSIPPVHDVGEMPDGRPFMAMKLIDGRTLHELLKEHPGESGRWLAAFEAVCQAVGYAHSRGVIHRDLKPQNVMIGAFGEVQVMDWGLAKRVADPDLPRPTAPADPSAEMTQAGEVLGTPAYLSPEQAAGEAATPRSDVFGLGGVLYFILTGRPPFYADSSTSALVRAAVGDLSAELSILDMSGTDPEVAAVCKACLAHNPADRPADGAAVATLVAEVRVRANERVRTAETARATAEVRANEERKRRRVQLALVGCVLGLVVAAVGGWVWADRNAAMTTQADAYRRERATAAVEDAVTDSADLRRRGLYAQAGRRLSDARRAAADAGDPDALGRADTALANLAAVEELDRVRLTKLSSGQKDERWDAKRSAAAYAAAFARRGITPHADPSAVAAALKESTIRAELITALDDWGLDERDADVRRWVWDCTGRATCQPWRADIPNADTAEKLKQVIACVPDADRSPPLLTAFGIALADDPAATVLLSDACRRHPADFWLLLALGNALYAREEANEAESAGCFRACLALRPDCGSVWVRLGETLLEKGDLTEAERCFRRGLEEGAGLVSDSALTNLAKVARESGDPRAALVHLKAALDFNPQFARAHYHTGMALRDLGQLDDAEAACRKAVAAAPTYPRPQYYLAWVLREKGDLKGVAEALERAAELDPNENEYLLSLASTRRELGQFEAVTAALERALALRPANQSIRQLLDRSERQKSLAADLPALLSGKREVKTSQEMVEFAGLAGAEWCGEYAMAVQLYERVERAEPVGFATLQYPAARAAVSTLAGWGKSPKLDSAETARLHRLARGWLREWLAQMKMWVEAADHHPRRQARDAARGLLVGREWAHVRGKRLASLPDTERREWEAFWAEVNELLASASGPPVYKP